MFETDPTAQVGERAERVKTHGEFAPAVQTITSSDLAGATIEVEELAGAKRRVSVQMPNGTHHACETEYPAELIESILRAHGPNWLCDEIGKTTSGHPFAGLDSYVPRSDRKEFLRWTHLFMDYDVISGETVDHLDAAGSASSFRRSFLDAGIRVERRTPRRSRRAGEDFLHQNQLPPMPESHGFSYSTSSR